MKYLAKLQNFNVSFRFCPENLYPRSFEDNKINVIFGDLKIDDHSNKNVQSNFLFKISINTIDYTVMNSVFWGFANM